MAVLFEPLTIGKITLRNRIGVSPMCMYNYTDGFSNDWHITHLGARAAGGAGLVVAEATAVEPRGRISAQDLGIWSDAHVPALRRLASAIKTHGAAAGIQIGHAGRKANTLRPWGLDDPSAGQTSEDWDVVGASAIPYSKKHAIPRALEINEIKAIQSAFRDGAKRALAAGFDWLEIHGAHGYLIHSFLSPLSNQRDDDYGGSFENCARFLVEIIAEVKTVWPDDLPLSVRISGTEWAADGWSVEDSAALAVKLKAAGVHLIDCSAGGNVSGAKYETGPGYQVFISDAVRQKAGVMTAAVGMITEAKQANAIIERGQADLVLLGRAMLRDPFWAVHAAQALDAELPTPPQYERVF